MPQLLTDLIKGPVVSKMCMSVRRFSDDVLLPVLYLQFVITSSRALYFNQSVKLIYSYVSLPDMRVLLKTSSRTTNLAMSPED